MLHVNVLVERVNCLSLLLGSPPHLHVDIAGERIYKSCNKYSCAILSEAGDVSCFYDPHLGRRRVEHHDHAQVAPGDGHMTLT